MTNNKETKLTLKQHIKLICRGLKLILPFSKPIYYAKTFLDALNAIFPFINIYFSAQILNEITGEKRQDKLIMFVLLLLFINLTVMIIKSIVEHLAAHYGTITWHSMRKLFTDKLLSMDYKDIENSKIQQEFHEIMQYENNMGFGLPKLLSIYDGLISSVIQIILAVTMSFPLFLFEIKESSPLSFLNSPIAVAIIILLILLHIIVSPRLAMIGRKIWIKAADEDNKGNRIFCFYFFELMNSVNRAKDIRIYDQKRLIKKMLIQNDSWQKYSKYEAKFGVLGQVVSLLSNGFIYLFVVLKAYAGAFGVGGIVQYVSAISQFSNGLASLHSNINTLITNNAFLEKALKFLDTPNEKYLGTKDIKIDYSKEYIIEFKNVSFKYPSSDTYALKNVNLKFKSSQRLAIVGMNGSGKTTLIKLLSRLYDPTDGTITLNGVDIREYKYDDYKNIYSIIFQDFTLLPFTLAQNVAVGVKYDIENVNNNLSKVGLSKRVKDMPKNIETYLYKNFGDEGVEISRGEAQKIALARALYKNAPILILDEPTAALDPIAEFEVYSNFNNIIENKTAIFISHRLSSCRFCDEIIVFHESQLVQKGNHDTLLNDKTGKYYELWNAQAQFYT